MTGFGHGLFGICLAAVLLAACGDGGGADDATADPSLFAKLGDPLPTVSSAEQAAFERGRQIALRRFTPATGLGPAFNVSFCGGCHEKPVLGGSAGHYRDFTLVGRKLLDDTVVPRGKNGVQRQYSLELGREPSDMEANVIAPRNPIPFFGAGLLLEIPEEEILRRTDPDDLDADGISGRANIVDGFVGRFGRKAQTSSLEIFLRGPLFNHLGITTEPLSASRRALLPMRLGGAARTTAALILKQAVIPDTDTIDLDGAPDPELSDQDLFDLLSFTMLLAPPTPDEPSPQTRRGSDLFSSLGCDSCHSRSLEGPRGPVPAYTDLLLHDMGEALADRFSMQGAGPAEFRTQPLWGVVAVAPYLHDGRAGTLDEAIRWHGGEAEASATAYAELSEGEQGDLLAFLASLGGATETSEGLLPPGTAVPDVGAWGGPSAALDEPAQQLFLRGRALFDRDVPWNEGTGPLFNGDSCRACHFDPVIGGAGPSGVDAMRQGVFEDGEFRAPRDGTGLPRHANFAGRPEPDPEASFFEPRQTPALFGLGLVERIPRQLIEDNADPEDLDNDGITGRAHILNDGELGRFGWKANVPSLREFVRDALSNELGLTVPMEPGLSFGHPDDEDEAEDPEIDIESIDAIAGYLSLLAPPPRTKTDPAREDEGEQIFETVGCGSCHVPSFPTTDGAEVHPYSDLLLHDVAEDGVLGIEEGAAGIHDFRTPPLWGLGQTGPYMHDGRASSIEAAIGAHAGEASRSRNAVSALSSEERAALLAFLKSL